MLDQPVAPGMAEHNHHRSRTAVQERGTEPPTGDLGPGSSRASGLAGHHRDGDTEYDDRNKHRMPSLLSRKGRISPRAFPEVAICCSRRAAKCEYNGPSQIICERHGYVVVSWSAPCNGYTL